MEHVTFSSTFLFYIFGGSFTLSCFALISVLFSFVCVYIISSIIYLCVFFIFCSYPFHLSLKEEGDGGRRNRFTQYTRYFFYLLHMQLQQAWSSTLQAFMQLFTLSLNITPSNVCILLRISLVTHYVFIAGEKF